ncbi:LysM peptidoglycan-binding domain-containing protein [Variovorax arabinosiphilus]|uniref:LysM peptidoglycan-binding domain-containing protein n=1 Tax=Variovorax arabinosiphilus TaxID=3053498 RepID=UPI00257718C2|nr:MULTISPECIES: LysM peptidoglycan-binding domain-containing protein [unclassified Variovorax]MDM0122209.1 LysM peptidoglycan-binding domain-containing protein [Variovorax sp. J2L1-78]MDM0131262.1 LysM peptidoglycan-binding domain-containing protein [Variovorax sp. J2L1-63]MDM0234972.1 LysM peptidoglycan-binding domain-containing protein [Variovorax sp. J2R1-6]
MAAIVSGNSLGLSLTSLSTLGQRGVLGTAGQGRNAEQSFVNIANGNLVLQDFDDRLEGRGLDIAAVRTYNSQGLFTDDNGDNWNVGAFGQSMLLTGTMGATGSTVTRTDRDGAQAVYAWDSSRSKYVSTAGAGAFDTVAHDAATGRWIWTDGSSGLIERYETSGAGRLMSVVDPSGNTVSYAYNANGTLQSMSSANGEVTYFDYTGTNLTQIRTVAAGGSTLTRVRYVYDAANRLSSVSVDLSPEDNSVSDGSRYLTAYTYDGTSKRIASVTQSDGTSLQFTYVQTGGQYRVATVTDGMGGVTYYNYDTVNRRTNVIDPMGLVTVYTYDPEGRLVEVKAPATGGVSATTTFSYNSNGDVLQVIDGKGQAVTMQYDANGNQVLQRDAAGNTISRTFDTHNQLLTETVYAIADPDGAGSAQAGAPETTRYVYDGSARNLLRFVVSPSGRVTEYRYDSYGQKTSAIDYTGSALYDTTALNSTTVPSEAQMSSWAASTSQRTQSSRTDFAYDARGQLQRSTTYAGLNADGTGVVDGTQSVNEYVYDRSGLLLSTVNANGGLTQYAYDGLGRQIAARDALNNSTLTSYDDAGGRTTVTSANGLATTSAYDSAGRLIGVWQRDPGGNSLGETTFLYDPLGRPYMRVDPTGVRTGMLYDEAGRLVAEIDGTWRLTEYVYDANGQVTQRIVYANPTDPVMVAQLLANPAAAPANLLTPLRPAASAGDQRLWKIYDQAGRLVRSIDSAGAVTDTVYDGASRVVAVIERSTRINTSALGTAPTFAQTEPASDAANDRISRSFYDSDGLLRATLDAEGYLVEFTYDAGGRLVEQLAYGVATASAQRATGSLPSLLATLDRADPQNQRSRWLYDAQNRIAAEINAEGYLTERVYDAAGNVTQAVRYATRVDQAFLTTAIDYALTVPQIRPASRPEDRSTVVTYDSLGRTVRSVNYEGTATEYSYDSVGHLVRTTSAAGTAEARTLTARYDIQGRLVGELTGEGSALLTGNQTQAQIDAIWAQYGLTHTYDAAGRRTSTVDGYGNKTRFYYDYADHLTHTIDALGEVQERTYNTLGQVIATVQYGTRISASVLAGLGGGVIDGTIGTALNDAVNTIRNPAVDSHQTFTYAATGQLSASTDALGNATQFNYNAFGETVVRSQAVGDGRTLTETSTRDRRGLVTGTALDASGVNAISSAVYDAFGRTTRSVDANGNVRQQTYDRLGRVITTRDPLNALRSASYDAFDQVLSQTDALGNTTFFAYDKALRSVAITSPEGITITTVHSRQGQTQRVVDGNGNTTSFSYDRNGNLLSTTTALTTTTNTYDRSNRLSQTVDANGNTVEFTYDGANRLLQRIVDPGGLRLITTYEYDAKGQQIGVTDPNGTLTRLEYDRKGQLIRQSVDPSGLNLVTQYTYDGRGKTLTVVSPGGTTVRYSYDTLGRRTQEQVDPAGLNLTSTFSYDKNGNVTGQTDPNGNLTRFVYDADDRLIFTLDALGRLQRDDYDAEGRIVRTQVYAAAVSLSGLPTSPSLSDIESRAVANTAADHVEHRVFDKDGRLVATVSGLGEVVKFTYDPNGNVIERVAYAQRIALSGWVAGSVPSPAVDAMHDQRVRVVYDVLNRATHTIDGTGAVVRQSFDGNGNVVERTAYATAVSVSATATAAQLDAALVAVANVATDAHDRLVYDRANRLTWSANGVGAVSQRLYDKNGNLTKRIDYATPVAAPAQPSTVPPAAGDRITDAVYDRANRQIFGIDAVGAVTKTGYDKNGNIVLRYAFAARLAPPTRTGALTGAQVESALTYAPLDQDRISIAMFDAANRQIAVMDGSGAVTETAFDAVGNAVRSTARANRINLAHLGNNWSADHWDLRALTSASSADRITKRSFDAESQLIFSVDALGYVKKNSYDSFGQLSTVTEYALAISATNAGTAASIAGAVVADPGDRTNRFAYDAAGRLSTSTDPLGASEHYGYNALGLKTSFTNKLGAVWSYDYDAAGRMTQETAPAVDMTALVLDGAGNLVVDAAHSGSANLVTRMAYDALGNLRARTEALGRPEQRTTTYAYDAVGHQIKVIYPEVGVYNPAGDNLVTNGASGLAARTETLSTLYTETRYDVFGNAVSNRDVAGNYSYKAYDVRGQLRYDVDALGYVTGYLRNTWGDVIELTRFAAATALTSGNPSSLNSAQVEAAISAAGVDHSKDRRLLTDHDALGRVVRTRESEAFVYDSTKEANQYFTGARTTVNTYDAFGGVTQVAVLTNALTQEWARTSQYYNLKGELVATVDALGYLTTQGFDAVGNQVLHQEFATAIAGWNPQSPAVGVPSTAASASDRLTLYSFDLAGRKTSESRVNVELGVGAFSTLVTGFGYDAVGNLTRTTDATGASTYSYFDALGRVRAVAAPARYSSATNTVLTPLTEFRRDAYGNALVITEFNRGAASANETSYAVAADAADRASFAAYDRLGHVTQTTDAARSSKYSSYDAQGHLAKEWRMLTNGDGASSTLFRAYQYDKLGQQTHVIDPASTAVVSGGTVVNVSQAQAGLVDSLSQFNAFGEVTNRSVNGQAGEYFDYDNAGNVWRTNAGDGVDKVAFYNLMGLQTSQMISYGATYANLNLRTASAPAELLGAPTRRTDMVYDALGHLVRTVGVEHQEISQGPTTGRTYSQASITSSATRASDESGISDWMGTNRVSVSWAPLSQLGSGDVKVVIEYLTVAGQQLDESNNPIPITDESGNVVGTTGLESRTHTQIFAAAPGLESATLSWEDPDAVTGGISKITRMAVYKKDLYGNWQQITNQQSLGYGGQVIDVATPTDPSTTVQLEIRLAGTPGDGGWASAGLVNFGDKLRFDASGLAAGTYEYRATEISTTGTRVVVGTGNLTLSAPALQVIGGAIGFPAPGSMEGVLYGGQLMWQPPALGVEQVFRMRPVGSTGAWTSVAVGGYANGKDGVDVANIAAGTYDYELLWIHPGEGVPYAHATGQIASTGFRPPQTVPQQNYPVIFGVSADLAVLGGNVTGVDESGFPIYETDESGNLIGGAAYVPVVQWPLDGVFPVSTVTFRYRLQGSSDWQTLPVQTVLFGTNESSLGLGKQQVDLRGLPPGNYDYEIVAQNHNAVRTGQALGVLTINPPTPGHYTPTQVLVNVPVTITPADPSGYIVGYTGGGVTYGPPVVVGQDPFGNPIFGQGYGRDLISAGDESSGPVYGPVRAIPYYTYHTEQVTQTVPVQVVVGQDPVWARDEAGNIITTPVFETRTGTRTVGTLVQVGTAPIYATDEAGNIQYQTIYETHYEQRTVPVYTWVQVPRTEAYTVAVQGPPVMVQNESGQWVPALDEAGNVIYTTAYETHYRTVYDWVYAHTGWATETYPVQVAVSQPIITGYQPVYETRYHEETYTYQVQVGTNPVQALDESGNPIYVTRYETQYQQQTVQVQVRTLVTPADPNQFIISSTPGDPVYGAPVVVGQDESNNPIYGQGYSMVNGVVVATPYVVIQRQWQVVDVWVPGAPTAPSSVDTTPPYTPSHTIPAAGPSFASSNTTAAGSSMISGTGTAGAPANQSPWIDGYGQSPRPVINRNVDRWGNALAISDPRSASWVTTYRYNANNQLIEQKQPDADGNASANAPVTQISYDAMGRQIAVRDANGHVQGRVYDQGGNLVEEHNADTGVIRHGYNAFGDKVVTVDAMDNATGFTYDNVGRLLETRYGSVNIFTVNTATNWAQFVTNGQIVERNEWDQAGRKLSQTNGDGEKIRYVYDLGGHVVRTIQPMGQSTQAAYDAQGRKIAEVDGNGYMATWSYSYFGSLMAHSDFGGRQYGYTYDNAGKLNYDSGTNRHYQYTSEGYVSRIFDGNTGQLERYEYDKAGNRIREWFAQGTVYKDNHIAYDALGRMRWVADGRAYINIEYDKVGNRTHINTHVLTQDASLDSNLYYQYDAMNRQTVVDAVDAAGNIGQQGHLIQYDKNGNRTQDTWWGNRVTTVDGQSYFIGLDESGVAMYYDVPATYHTSVGYTTEQYSYDSMRRMTSVVRDGVQTDARFYDAASRVVQTGPAGGLPQGYINALNGTNWQGQALAGSGSETRVNRYNDNGQILRQDVYKSDHAIKYTAVYEALGGGAAPGVGGAGGYDAAGNLQGYTVFDYSGGNGVSVTNYANAYDRAEGYRQTSTYGTNNHNNPGQTIWSYGNGGELTGIQDVTLGTMNRTFVSDMAGTTVYAQQNGEGQYQLVVNGEVLGRYGQIRDEDNPTISASGGTPARPNFKTTAEFNFGYRPIDGNYPSASPGTYAVSAGDTLQGIARGAYGDESLWYLIADANGLGSNADLKAGQVLTIPARVGSANASGTFKPYDPTRIVGDTSPNLPVPEQDEGGCGGFAQIIMVVVAVVVTVYTGYYIGVDQMTGAAAVAGGAASGAAGSVASQVVGNAIGAQDGFSWKQVALSAVGGAVGAGMGGFAPTGNVIADAAIRGAIGSALTQGVAVATGLQSSFNWKSVVASAVGAGVGKAVGGELNAAWGGTPVGDFAVRAGSGLAAGATTAVLRGGRVSVTQVAVDAFGNALGDSIAAANGQGSGSYASEDPLGGLIALNGGWSGVSTNLPQSTGSFSPDMSATTADQLLADLGSGGRSYGGGGTLYADASRVLRSGVMTDAGGGGINPGSVESLRQPDGTYRAEINGVADESPAFTDAEVVSMRAENLARAQALAAQDATAYSSGVMSNEGRAAGTPLAPFPDRWVRPDMVDGSFAAGHWEPLGNDSPNEARRLSNYPSREMQLVGYSNQQASDFSATQWKGFAAEYKAIQGSNFTRDSFYNGLWTKGAQLDIAAGNTNRGIFDEMAGVAGAAGAHADVGLAAGRGIGQGIGNGLGNVMGMAGRKNSVGAVKIGGNVQPNAELVGPSPELIGPQLPPWKGPIDYGALLKDGPRVGVDKPFTAAQKRKIAEQNTRINDGLFRSDEDGAVALNSPKSQSGVSTPRNAAQFDHKIPRKPADPNVSPGTNSYSNAAVLTSEQNRAKSNK